MVSTMTDEKDVRPIRQGSIDHLCGVYSVLNATETVIGKYRVDRKRKKKSSQRKTLFNDLIGHLAKNNLLKEALTTGIDDIDIGLIDVAIESVRSYQNQKMRKRKVFETDDGTLDEYWEQLTRHLSSPDSAVIILLTGRIKPWTCVKAITPDAMILSDSTGMKKIARSHCTVDTESSDLYTLWPAMTYLLSVERKDGDECIG